MSWLIEIELETDEFEVVEAKNFYARVMAALIELDVFDPMFHGEITSGPVWIGAAVFEDDLIQALGHATTAIRCAIHDAGGSTPGWPHLSDLPQPEQSGDGKWVISFGGISQRPLAPSLA